MRKSVSIVILFFTQVLQAQESFCKSQSQSQTSDGYDVILCEEFYDSRPYIHVPDEKIMAMNTINWPIGQGSVYFRNSKGQQFYVVNGDGQIVPFDVPMDQQSQFHKDIHAPTYRYLNLLYEVTGVTGNSVDPYLGSIDTIKVEKVVPILQIAPRALEQHLLGIWTGDVTVRREEPTGFGSFLEYFDKDVFVPLEIEFIQLDVVFPDGLSEWKGSGTVEGTAPSYKLIGRINNFSHFDDLGEKNPFKGATDSEVELYRHSNMHGLLFDDHWVFTYPNGTKDISVNGMSDGLSFFDPASLIAEEQQMLDEKRRELTIYPHVPFRTSGNIIRLMKK